MAHSGYVDWYQLCPPVHLHYFTPGSLAKLLRQCGFHVLNQLTCTPWSARIDRAANRLAKTFSLPPSAAYLLQVICYKLGKVYFDRTIQHRLQGLTLLSMSSPKPWNVTPHFRKYF